MKDDEFEGHEQAHKATNADVTAPFVRRAAQNKAPKALWRAT
jgi:hypothetical protein